MQFDIQLQAEQTERLLAAIAHDLDAPHDMLESIGQALLNVNEDRHKEQVDPDGAPWAPLHPKTIQRKTNPRMLVEHGDLLRFYSQVDDDTVKIGTRDYKAHWHQNGTDDLPARPMVGFPDSDQQLVDEVIDDNLRAILRRAL